VEAVAYFVSEAITIRRSRRGKNRIFALAVTLLALGMFVQAVHSKNSDYFPKTTQSTYFSASVKIANLVHHDSVEPGAVLVLRGVLPLARPPLVRTPEAPESLVQKLTEQISFRPLRSPPVAL
jgi:hypothetical protein